MTAKKNLNFIIVCLVAFMLIHAFRDMNKREESIENNKFETVAKVYKFHSNRSFNRYYYFYYYGGKKYIHDEDIGNGERDQSIGKFYKVNLSTENPNYAEIILAEEITDSLKIKNAGF